MLVYRILARFLRLVARVFFRQIEVVGLEHVPKEGEGPLVFAGNHPNSLVDPVLIIAFCGRIVHFAAKDVLFRNRLLRMVLRGLGAVPIARRVDHPEGPLSNESAFEALFGVLGEGRAMGIFPEGLSHEASELGRLKTGAARVALGVCARHPDLTVRIVPCGLSYIHRRRFRSRVLLQFGRPIEITTERVANWRVDEQAAARALTADLERALRGLTINAADWETLRVLDGVRRLYQPERISIPERVELARRFNDVYPRVKDDPEVVAIVAGVRAYQQRLDDLGLTDADLRRRIGPLEAFGLLVRQLVLALVWLPLAVPGVVLHAPILSLAALAGERLTPRKDVIATTKLVAGLLGALVLFSAIIVWVSWRYGLLVGACTLAFLIVSGYATLRILDRSGSVRRLAATLPRLYRLRAEIAALTHERDRLEANVVGAVDRLRPADMVPLFPRAGLPIPSEPS
jgi:1-acyl-sn-glycerol-3-phosphate acyltransferase